MDDKQKQITNLLWKFESLRDSHIIKMCKCNEKDINILIARKVISRDRETKLLKCNTKKINSRNVVAFDVVMEYLDRNVVVEPGKGPVTIYMKTDCYTYDIITVKEFEIDKLFQEIDSFSKADRIIIIIETKQYMKRKLNTTRPCLICTYPPVEIVDRIN